MASLATPYLLFHTGGEALQCYGTTWRRLSAIERIAPTFDRESVGAYTARDGKVQKAAVDNLRCHWFDLDGDGIFETPGLLVEGSRTNLVTYSDDLTQWSVSGTPVVTKDAISIGALKLSKVEDDDAGAVEYIYIVPTFTADGAKAISFVIKKGASAPAAGSHVRLQDVIAAASRLRLDITWAGDGTPIINATVGTYIATRRLANGAFRICAQAVDVVAANTNRIEIHPAQLWSQTGDIYCGGVMAENAVFPSESIIQTAGATASRAAETLDQPFAFGPRDLTVYCKVIRPLFADLTGQDIGLVPDVLNIATSTPRTYCVFGQSSRNVQAKIVDGDGTPSSVSASIPSGSTVDWAFQCRNFASDPQVRLDVGSGFGSWSTSGALDPFTKFGNQTFRIPDPYCGVISVKVASGLWTLTEMQNA